MPKPPPLGDELLPPFEGFPGEGIRFLKRLKRNNNRPWFQAHKHEYEEFVRFPMQCLVSTLKQRMGDIAPEFDFSPRRSIFRIYRDTRFSANTAPYKTNIAASFELRGTKGHIGMPGLYVGVGPDEIFVGGGLYLPDGEQLKAIRRSIAEHPDEFLQIVKSPSFRRILGSIEGERLIKAPLGYPKDHPMIEYLRYRQFYVGVEPSESAPLRAGFADLVTKVLTASLPFVRWLIEAVRS